MALHIGVLSQQIQPNLDGILRVQNPQTQRVDCPLWKSAKAELRERES